MLTIAALLIAALLALLLLIALGGNADLARELETTRTDRDHLWDESVTLRRELRAATTQRALWHAEAMRGRAAAFDRAAGHVRAVPEIGETRG